MEVSGQLYAPTTLHPRKEPLVPDRKEAGWAPAGLDAVDWRKISYPRWESNSHFSAVEHVAHRYAD
jgi:hypothetical protein